MKPGRPAAFFAQVFQGKVAAQAKPDEVYRSVVFLHGMLNNHLQVIGGSAVVKAQLPVHFLAAAPVIPGENIKTIAEQGSCHSFYIRPVRIAFQAVRDDNEAIRALPEPVQI